MEAAQRPPATSPSAKTLCHLLKCLPCFQNLSLTTAVPLGGSLTLALTVLVLYRRSHPNCPSPAVPHPSLALGWGDLTWHFHVSLVISFLDPV